MTTDTGVDHTAIKVGAPPTRRAPSPCRHRDHRGAAVFRDDVDATGRIAGRQIEVVMEDNAYDIAQNVQKHQILREEMALFSQVTGSPHTAAMAQDLVADELVASALTFYSGLADPAIGQNVFETFTNDCIESMNGLWWLQESRDVRTVVIVSFPGEYGIDAAAGAKLAADGSKCLRQ